jgi:hypothetical protein
MTELALATETDQPAVTRRGFWRSVRRRPTFWICSVVIGLLVLLRCPKVVRGLVR